MAGNNLHNSALPENHLHKIIYTIFIFCIVNPELIYKNQI
jgi:hypothetical protein